jgi:hypothetical protein
LPFQVSVWDRFWNSPWNFVGALGFNSYLYILFL